MIAPAACYDMPLRGDVCQRRYHCRFRSYLAIDATIRDAEQDARHELKRIRGATEYERRRERREVVKAGRQ